MDYWAETMQDDAYLIAADGWKAETYRVIEKNKNGKEKDKGWACDLLPKLYIVARYFATEQALTPVTPGSARTKSRGWWWTTNGSLRWMPRSMANSTASARP
jgi:hypothetical protein